MLVYATSDQLATWLGTTPPSNTASLLRSATFVVAGAANRDPYNDAPTGIDAQALADATCAQTASWVALGVDPAQQGITTSVVAESKIGSADVKRVAPAAADIRAAVTELAPEARNILYTAGLLALPVPVGADPFDPLASFGVEGPYGMVVGSREGREWYGPLIYP